MQNTSMDAWRKLNDSGALKGREKEVLGYLDEFGPATANELFQRAKGANYIVQANFHARLNGLLKKGKVKINQKRTCSVTGERVIEWAIGDAQL